MVQKAPLENQVYKDSKDHLDLKEKVELLDFLALQVVLVTEVLLEISAKLLDLLDLQDRKEALEILASHAKMVKKENKVKVETKDHKVYLEGMD